MKRKLFGNDERIRKQQLELISMLNRWYQIKEDLLFAFEKCGESTIGEPTKSIVRDFVARVRGGLEVERALDLFAASYPTREFKNFAVQIRFNLKYRGNTGELLDNLETQFSRIEEEWTRRKIESSKDRMYLNGIILLTPVIAAIVFLYNRSARELFFSGSIGLLLCLTALLSYGTGILTYYISSKHKR